MNIKKNMQNFLMDQDYYIDIFANSIHIYNYIELINLSDTLIEIKLTNFSLIIKGNNFLVTKMDKHEILIKGILLEMRFIR